MLPAHQRLAGVYAAAVTPLKSDFSPDTDALLPLLGFLAQRGCHGALLLGTTGEGPSFAPEERLNIFRAALEIRPSYPDFHLLAGTGTPSLEETIALSRSAFEIGFDGVVVLPPYYFRGVSDNGLYAWFSEVLRRAVPSGGILLGYHIPHVSGVPLSLDLLVRLKDAFPHRFAGLKDSSGDADYARQLGERFGEDLLVLTGNDRLLSLALQHHASGCITALANLMSPTLRLVWDTSHHNRGDPQAQTRLNAARTVMERYPPAASLIKALLSRQYQFPNWTVRPPLLPISPEVVDMALDELITQTA